MYLSIKFPDEPAHLLYISEPVSHSSSSAVSRLYVVTQPNNIPSALSSPPVNIIVAAVCCLLSPPQPAKTEEATSARERLAGMAGTSSAFYDLDSDGYGLTSRENIKTMMAPPADVKEVEKALKEKARYILV